MRWPLAGTAHPLRGGFGETRSNHFHAGLDLSTGQRIGAPVFAPGTGTLERVRTSGVGYGRSLYLRLTDGRLIVLGHLDAFEPRLAAWVDSVQRVTATYEQDLWPEAGLFRYAVGDPIAWSGESGAGPPHLHVEVRHGDFGMNPLMAGLAVPDTVAPRIETLVLEPLDDRSWVSRRAAPYTLRLRDRGEDTLLVEGRVRLTLVASDATNEARDLPVRLVGARWNGQWVECRMDSISWATDMAQTGWLLDRGRVTGSGGVILDARGRLHPRFLASSRPDSLDLDLVHVIDGAAAKPLELVASDAAGNETVRRVWLRGPRWNEVGPDARGATPTPPARKGAAAPAIDPQWSFAALPDQRVRVRVVGTPPGLREVHFERGGTTPETGGSMTASWDGEGWSATLYMNGTPDPDGLWIKGRLPDGKAWWHRGAWSLWAAGSSFTIKQDEWAWCAILPDQVYESGVVLVRARPITGTEPGASPVRAAFELLPADLPVLKPVTVHLRIPAGVSLEHLQMYRRDREGTDWEWADGVIDTAGSVVYCKTSRFGQFALLRDDAPPEVVLQPTPPRGSEGPYSRWAFTARVTDATSGIAGRRCRILIDGKAVPAEWDAEDKLLRWRPLAMPVKGRHEVTVEAEDRVGNRTVRSGTFVIVSR